MAAPGTTATVPGGPLASTDAQGERIMTRLETLAVSAALAALRTLDEVMPDAPACVIETARELDQVLRLRGSHAGAR